MRHVIAYPGGRHVARADRLTAGRIAENFLVRHPDTQVHVKACVGASCRWCQTPIARRGR